MHQYDAEVGGLEAAPALHRDVVALADVVDVHGDAGVRAWKHREALVFLTSGACPKLPLTPICAGVPAMIPLLEYCANTLFRCYTPYLQPLPAPDAYSKLKHSGTER